MYRNDTRFMSIQSTRLGLYCILHRSTIISAFWRIDLKQAALRRVCRVLICKRKEGMKLAISTDVLTSMTSGGAMPKA